MNAGKRDFPGSGGGVLYPVVSDAYNGSLLSYFYLVIAGIVVEYKCCQIPALVVIAVGCL